MSKTKEEREEGGEERGAEAQWPCCCINANSGERCQEKMGDEENAADFILIC